VDNRWKSVGRSHREKRRVRLGYRQALVQFYNSGKARAEIANPGQIGNLLERGR
jgi:hypothetical protein